MNQMKNQQHFGDFFEKYHNKNVCFLSKYCDVLVLIYCFSYVEMESFISDEHHVKLQPVCQ